MAQLITYSCLLLFLASTVVYATETIKTKEQKNDEDKSLSNANFKVGLYSQTNDQPKVTVFGSSSDKGRSEKPEAAK